MLREIGRGGMGVVYEAEQESLGRRVALKILPFHSTFERSAIERFERETRAAAQLQHPGIVPLYEAGEIDGVHFYTMPFVEGQGLDSVLVELRALRAGNESPDETSSPASPSTSAKLSSLVDGLYSGTLRVAVGSPPDDDSGGGELTADTAGASSSRVGAVSRLSSPLPVVVQRS